MITLIIATDKYGTMGMKDTGDLQFNVKADMQNFKKVTDGGTVILGRKTMDTLPSGGLKGRDHIVVSNTLTQEDVDGLCGESTIAVNLEELEKIVVGDKDKDFFLIGGPTLIESIWANEVMNKMITKIHLTLITPVDKDTIPIENCILLNSLSDILSRFTADEKLVTRLVEQKDRISGKLVNIEILRYVRVESKTEDAPIIKTGQTDLNE